MLIAAVLYHLWRQRTNVRFLKTQLTEDQMEKGIENEIKWRIEGNIPKKKPSEFQCYLGLC